MRKSLIITSILSSVALATVVVASASNGSLRSLFKTSANPGSNNSLYLIDQKISTQSSSYSGEISGNVHTDNNNLIQFKCANVINNTLGWQTILPGGYFYNPLTNSSSHNKITGIESIRFNSDEKKNLSLCYGYTLDNENIIYTYEKDLIPNQTYNLNGLNPSYLYIKNNNNSNVAITDFNICYSCVESTYPKQNLNVLMIGNSFADDTVFYTKRVAAAYGININIHDAYIGSCNIDKHYANLSNGSTEYSMRSTNGDSWVYNNDMTLPGIIASNTWDIITFQQASGQIGRSDSYGNLSNLVSGVRSLVGSSPKFYWYQTWAYDWDYHETYDYFSYFNNDQIAMYNAINDCYTNYVRPLNLFEKIISGGTAVQNLRTSYMKDMFTRDGKHMSQVHGRYLLGLNFLSQLYDIDLSKSPCSFKPTGVNDSFKTVAYESIKNAEKNPLICTNSAYSTLDLGNYNLANYTEIDAELVGCSYWNSTDSSNYNKRFANSNGSSNKYVSTKRFTSSTLPVGSLVVIGEPFGVRPEAWVSDAQQSTRPDVTYDNVIEITSSFWSGYQYRAFNIFKAGTPDLSGQYLDEQYDDIFDTFHIYVPTASLGSIKPKTYNPNYNDDKSLFISNSLNIDAFERAHLDPITGFYKCDSYYYLMNSYVDSTAQKFVCTRPFDSASGDLPENTVLVVDGGYQWRSDCWGSQGTHSRPENVSANFTKLTSSFMSGLRTRTFNVSKTNGATVGQDHRAFMDHFRIYIPISSDIEYLPEYPEGTFRGDATVSGNSFSIVISIGTENNHMVGVRLANQDAVATGITYNSSTHLITITTTGNYSGLKFGNITGTYDRANKRITGVSCSGAIKSYVSNNGSITCTKASTSSNTYFATCDASTSSLQSEFKRRYKSSDWQVDSSNSDRIVSNTTQFVTGTGSLKLRGYSGGAVALNLKSDFSTPKTVKNIHFWVYNPNGSDITLRLFGYRTTGLSTSDYFEAGNVTAKASSWTYLAMGFTEASIYNFQIADFTNSGAYLSFDNIYLF